MKTLRLLATLLLLAPAVRAGGWPEQPGTALVAGQNDAEGIGSALQLFGELYGSNFEQGHGKPFGVCRYSRVLE